MRGTTLPEKMMNKTEAEGLALQSGDLHLFVYDRPLHPELFRHFADFQVEQGRYRADIWVIGLSHVVTVTQGDHCLTELLARQSDMLPTRGVLSRFRLKGERDHERRTGEGWGYMVSTQIETMDEALYKSVHHDLLRHTEKRGWYVPYEAWSDGELVPFSYIDHEARDGEFHVHVFHAFPQERTLIKTQSIIELPG
jgi:hypothetical protein